MATKLVLQCESALVKWGFDAHKIFSTITYLVLGEKITIFQLLITVYITLLSFLHTQGKVATCGLCDLPWEITFLGFPHFVKSQLRAMDHCGFTFVLQDPTW